MATVSNGKSLECSIAAEAARVLQLNLRVLRGCAG